MLKVPFAFAAGIAGIYDDGPIQTDNYNIGNRHWSAILAISLLIDSRTGAHSVQVCRRVAVP